MHHAFLIQEILFNIFGHCPHFETFSNAELAVLARTCRAFKEPALDILWEELPDFSPLARCLPQACRASDKCYSFKRPLNESEWHTLRSYTRRVRHLRNPISSRAFLDASATRTVFTLAPFSDPLFPNLRSLFWQDFTIIPITHAFVPSLTSLQLDFGSSWAEKPPPNEFLDAIGEHCRYIKDFGVDCYSAISFDAPISRLVCRWPNLRSLSCPWIHLSADAIIHLTSMSTLDDLAFKLSADVLTRISHLDPMLVFPNLSSLWIRSPSLKTITRFLPYMHIPTITRLSVSSEDAWKEDVHACWTAVGRACPSDHTLDYLALRCRSYGIEGLDEEQIRPQLTLDDLSFCNTLRDLHGIHISLPWSVKLTDADLLHLVSKSPDLFELSINPWSGWRLDDEGGGGITLDGLIQLLRACPSLGRISLAIDTRTFTDVPQGLDVQVSPDMTIDVLDAHISPELVPGLASVLTALKVDPRKLKATCFGPRDYERDKSLWASVRNAMSDRQCH